MAAPTILGLIGTGLAVGKLHWPTLRGLADRSAEQSRRFADYSGAGPARAAAYRAVLPACDDVDAVLISHSYEVVRDALTAARTCSARSRPASTRSRPRPPSHWRPGIRTASSWWARTSSTAPACATSPRSGCSAGTSLGCTVPCGRPTARSTHRRTSRSISSSPEAPSATTPRPTPRSQCRPTSPMPCSSEYGQSAASRSVANATVVQRALDPVPGAGPVPLWRPRGSTGLFDGLPGQRISSSASFAA